VPPPATGTATATRTPGPPSPTATACPEQFTDVDPSNPFYSFIRCLACQGIISGYSDGTFRWGNNVTRGQTAKIVANAAQFLNAIPSTQQTFSDVPPNSTFWIFIERLAGRGYISGYSDGTFRPYNDVTRGQLAKIVSESAGFNDPIAATQQTFADVPANNAFWLFVERVYAHGVISGYTCGGAGEPCDPQQRPYFRWTANATRGQSSKIVSETFYPNCQVAGR
jgi:hypothetical protein